jgi:SAM-dependent methyltransferase
MDAVEPAAVPPIFDAAADRLSSAGIRASLARLIKGAVDRRIAASPALTGKLRPLGGSDGAFVLERSHKGEDVPPKDLWEGYADHGAAYLESGRRDADTMLRLLAEHGAGRFARVLDLGCAAGRVLRHLPKADDAEHWGVDISAAHIRWCQQNLAGLNFATTTTAPHLPFQDCYFELVFAASVFTHISDLADAWLLELRRVLRPGGWAYLTVHDLTSYELLMTQYASDPLFGRLTKALQAFEKRHRMRGRSVDSFSFGPDPDSQVFYNPDYLTAKWGEWIDVIAYVPQAHEHQSVLLLRKRSSI